MGLSACATVYQVLVDVMCKLRYIHTFAERDLRGRDGLGGSEANVDGRSVVG